MAIKLRKYRPRKPKANLEDTTKLDAGGKAVDTADQPPTEDPKPSEEVPDEIAIEQMVASQASALRDSAGAGYIYSVLAGAFGENCHTGAVQIYRDEFLRQCGDPADPLERLLIEEILLAFHAIGTLRLKAAREKSADTAVAFSDAGTRLQAEFRRCLGALWDHRARTGNSRSTLASVPDDKEAAQTPGNGHTSHHKPEKSATDTQLAKGNGSEMPQRIRDRMGFNPAALVPTG